MFPFHGVFLSLFLSTMNKLCFMLKPRLHERFFLNLSRRQRAVKITRVATIAQLLRWRQLKITEKKIARNAMTELNFPRQNHRLCHSCSHHRAPATRQFPEKIASPSQAKNRSCSRGITDRWIVNSRRLVSEWDNVEDFWVWPKFDWRLLTPMGI